MEKSCILMVDGMHPNEVLGVIPARYNSTRLPGKPLKIIAGKPMIYWVAKQVEHSDIKKYIVATDDQRILEECLKYHIPAVITSGECKNGTERVAEVATKIKSNFYLNIQGDEPCINPLSINQMINSSNNYEKIEYLQGVTLIKDLDQIHDPSVVKVAINNVGEIIYLSRAPIPFFKTARSEKKYFKCLGLYLYSREFLLRYKNLPMHVNEKVEEIEQLRVIENKIPIQAAVLDYDSLSVDTKEDLSKVRKLLNKEK